MDFSLTTESQVFPSNKSHSSLVSKEQLQSQYRGHLVAFYKRREAPDQIGKLALIKGEYTIQ